MIHRNRDVSAHGADDDDDDPQLQVHILLLNTANVFLHVREYVSRFQRGHDGAQVPVSN